MVISGAWLLIAMAELVEQLMAKPEHEQKNWMGRYLEAAPACDSAGLDELIRELA